jgi:uncharacterized membrane-anchored protein YitT (DUF2179 family)
MTFIQIDAVTSDRLLIALFGGCLIGGMGLCIRSGSVADGIEILAINHTKNWFKCFGSFLASIVLFFYPLLGSLVLVPHYTLLSLNLRC